MSGLIKTAVRQPITVAVGVILSLLAGLIALRAVPIAMTPEVQDPVISVTTTWENASPQEVESEVIDKQEERLQGVSGLRSMTSTSRSGQGLIRLEFLTGTDLREAMIEVQDKLREVESYPENVDQPVVEDVDPENRDYIAWVVLVTSDPDFDILTQRDWLETRILPRLERIPGVSEVGLLGGTEREAQIQVDPYRLAQRGVTMSGFIAALQASNANFSGGALAEGKSDVRVRTVGRFSDPRQVGEVVIRQTDAGPIYVKDVATVIEGYKEVTDFARARGRQCIGINFQRELGSNVMEVMALLKAELATLNAAGGNLDVRAQQLGLNGSLELVMTYDSTTYIEDAIALVRGNIFVGGALAIAALVLFLRSLRSVGIIAVAIPISIIGTVVVMVALGRTVNIISLAGMAFAIGMVVDNSIVVLENIYRHVEMGKRPAAAAVEGTREVASAVLASTLTTLVVFVPILLIEETAGRLFRDIALAICAAVALSFLVAVTVIPSAARLLLRERTVKQSKYGAEALRMTNPDRRAAEGRRILKFGVWRLLMPLRLFQLLPRIVAGLVYRLTGSYVSKLSTVTAFVAVAVLGTWWLMPPMDYLPKGNRNIIFSLLFPPPGYNVEQLNRLGARLEATMQPVWEAHGPSMRVERETGFVEASIDPSDLPRYPDLLEPGDNTYRPPPLEHYFVVAWNGVVFHVGIAAEKDAVIDLLPAFYAAAAPSVVPGVPSFAFQLPLFRIGGNTGSAVKIDLSGADLDRVTAASGALFGNLAEQFGVMTLQPDPPNFNVPAPELQFLPNYIALSDLDLTVRDLGLAAQAASDGIFINDYEVAGELIDMKVINADAVNRTSLAGIADTPLATPAGAIVSLGSVAAIERVIEPEQIRRVGRQRAVTLQFTPPAGMPLDSAVREIEASVTDLQERGAITPDVEVSLAGSASKLNELKQALLGDGSLGGFATSSLFLAGLIVYLLMCVLFQSWVYPFVIMFSVPLATFGGFLALSAVYAWSDTSRYMPTQTLDVLTILGFVILAGTVVNNAILLVDQALNNLAGKTNAQICPESVPEDVHGGVMSERCAIAMSVESRVRPILMSALTSIGGMLPLVLAPGAGSELYRGLGSVVVGGLAVSTVFTLILVPLVLSLVFDIRKAFGAAIDPTRNASQESSKAPGNAGAALLRE